MTDRRLAERLATYQKPDLRRSLGQIVTTVVPLVLLWAAMLRSLEYGYWVTLVLAVPAAACVVRLFLIQHDCAHWSFFRSAFVNDCVGFAIGLVTMTPHHYWRRAHAIHHATSGNLDRRGFGDIDTLTVAEYLALPRRRRFTYRLYRNPLVLFGVGPALHFMLEQRFCRRGTETWKRERASVYGTNMGLTALLLIMSAAVGWKRILLIQLPISILASSIGVWLFYVQHQFEETYWDEHERWNYLDAGIRGSSHYVLPKPLEWMTCHIGLHHIHHLNPRIPNYRLAQCLQENPVLQQATRLSVRESLKCASLKLWDEDQRKLVGYP